MNTSDNNHSDLVWPPPEQLPPAPVEKAPTSTRKSSGYSVVAVFYDKKGVIGFNQTMCSSIKDAQGAVAEFYENEEVFRQDMAESYNVPIEVMQKALLSISIVPVFGKDGDSHGIPPPFPYDRNN